MVDPTVPGLEDPGVAPVDVRYPVPDSDTVLGNQSADSTVFDHDLPDGMRVFRLPDG